MDRHKQLTINLIASVAAFAINMGISFFLTPYITSSIGVEAYGFVALGNDFINYALIVTLALNSMAGRFITIEIHRDNWEGANKYFNSVLLANILAAGVMIIPSILYIVYMDRIMNVPATILADVRILFAFLFTNYLIGIIVSSFGVSTFATNKLYLKSLREIESIIIKAIVLVSLFIFLRPSVIYLGFSAFIVLLYTTSFNIYYTKKLLPKIKIRKAYFDFKAVLELISSGIWNTIMRVGQIFLEGIDLLISNLFISATAMGTLALAKTIPTAILSLVGITSAVFIPDFTILYAQNRINELIVSIKRSMKILGIIATIPVSILVSFGEEFFRLWVPTQDPKLLQVLSIITVATIVVSGSINSIYGVFTVTNKLKTNAMVLIFTGILNLVIVFTLLKTTNLGIYAIAGVSTIFGTIRNLVFTAPFGAKYLGLRWTTFFPEIIKSVVAFIVATIIGFGANLLFDISSWPRFLVLSVVTAGLSLIINVMLILDKSEIKSVELFIKQKLGIK